MEKNNADKFTEFMHEFMSKVNELAPDENDDGDGTAVVCCVADLSAAGFHIGVSGTGYAVLAACVEIFVDFTEKIGMDPENAEEMFIKGFRLSRAHRSLNRLFQDSKTKLDEIGDLIKKRPVKVS